jgi:hypothetical protein
MPDANESFRMKTVILKEFNELNYMSERLTEKEIKENCEKIRNEALSRCNIASADLTQTNQA